MDAATKNGTLAEAQDSRESPQDRSDLGRQKGPSNSDIPIPLVAGRKEARSTRTKCKSNTIPQPATARMQRFATRWGSPRGSFYPTFVESVCRRNVSVHRKAHWLHGI